MRYLSTHRFSFMTALFIFILLLVAGCTPAKSPIMTNPPTSTPIPENTKTIPPTDTLTPVEVEDSTQIDIFSFPIVDDSGSQFDLSAYQNEPLLLIFFSVNCGHCHHEAEELEALYNDYQEKINFVALEVSGASNEEITQFTQDYGLSFAVAEDYTQELTRAMGVTGVPTNLLIQSNGALFDTLRGYRESDELALAIEQLLQMDTE